MPDKYDDAIAFIEQSPNPADAIRHAWVTAGGSDQAGRCLFKFVGNSGQGSRLNGCLTMIRKSSFVANTPDGEFDQELTDLIRADSRIPTDVDNITLETLPVFAEWQRLIANRHGVTDHA